MLLQPHRSNGWGFFVWRPTPLYGYGKYIRSTSQPDLVAIQKQRVEDASEFLSICDRLSTGYDSGYYWEDVQRALRIAAGLEKWCILHNQYISFVHGS